MLETSYKFGEVHSLANQVVNGEDLVHFKGIMQNNNGGVALLAFKAGQVLNTHVAPAELLVTTLEGEIEFTMAGTPHTIKTGEFMLVGEGVPHSVVAKADSKMMLVKIKG